MIFEAPFLELRCNLMTNIFGKLLEFIKKKDYGYKLLYVLHFSLVRFLARAQAPNGFHMKQRTARATSEFFSFL